MDIILFDNGQKGLGLFVYCNKQVSVYYVYKDQTIEVMTYG